MFLTITFSPSVDLVIQTEVFEINSLNRYKNFNLFPGGKGINASVVLSRMGFENTSITFFDKHTFNNLNSFWKKEQLNILNITNAGVLPTRYNVKMFSKTSDFFELNGPRNQINEAQKNKLFKLLQKLTDKDFVYILGVVEENLLVEILEILSKQKVKFGLDIDTKNIMKFINFKPYFYKPNLDELNINFKINSDKDIFDTLKHIQQKGTSNILLSLGDRGSILLDNKGIFYKSTLNIKVNIKSTVGAGDTLGSVFIANFLKTNNVEKSLILATATATSTVSQWWLAKKKEAFSFKKFVKVEKFNDIKTN